MTVVSVLWVKACEDNMRMIDVANYEIKLDKSVPSGKKVSAKSPQLLFSSSRQHHCTPRLFSDPFSAGTLATPPRRANARRRPGRSMNRSPRVSIMSPHRGICISSRQSAPSPSPLRRSRPQSSRPPRPRPAMTRRPRFRRMPWPTCQPVPAVSSTCSYSRTGAVTIFKLLR